jgi:hypothetical protein
MPLSSPPYQQQGKTIPIAILILLAISLAITVVLFVAKEVKKSFMARSIGDAQRRNYRLF